MITKENTPPNILLAASNPLLKTLMLSALWMSATIAEAETVEGACSPKSVAYWSQGTGAIKGLDIARKRRDKACYIAKKRRQEEEKYDEEYRKEREIEKYDRDRARDLALAKRLDAGLQGRCDHNRGQDIEHDAAHDI